VTGHGHRDGTAAEGELVTAVPDREAQEVQARDQLDDV
jgi:hypothetical protein